MKKIFIIIIIMLLTKILFAELIDPPMVGMTDKDVIKSLRFYNIKYSTVKFVPANSKTIRIGTTTNMLYANIDEIDFIYDEVSGYTLTNIRYKQQVLNSITTNDDINLLTDREYDYLMRNKEIESINKISNSMYTIFGITICVDIISIILIVSNK